MQTGPENFDAARIVGVIHDHRKSVRALTSALAYVRRFLGDDFTGDDPSATERLLTETVMPPARELRRLVAVIISQAEQRIGEPGAAEIYARLRAVESEIDRVLPEVSAAGLYRLRAAAVDAQDIGAAIRAAAKDIPLAREPLKKLQMAAREVERLVCLWDLRWAEQMTATTASELLIILNYLTGRPVPSDAADVHNVFESVDAAVAGHQFVAQKRGIELRVRRLCGDVLVAMPRLGLRRAISNLLDNGIKYTGELHPRSRHRNTWITVSVSSTHDFVEIAVESWGVPITSEEATAGLAFKYGYRGHYARQSRPNQGSGVGLTDVKTFVTRYGGDITLTTETFQKHQAFSNTTTTVTLRLPRIHD